MEPREAVRDPHTTGRPARRLGRCAALSISLHMATVAILVVTVGQVSYMEQRTEYVPVTLLTASTVTPNLYASQSAPKPESIATPASQKHRRAAHRTRPVAPTSPEVTHSASQEAAPISVNSADAPATGAEPLASRGGGGATAATSEGDDRESGPIPMAKVAHPPELLSRIIPDYPPVARLRNIEGVVLLEIVVDRVGQVEDSVRVIQSEPMLDRAAIDAVRRWRFRPGRDRADRPVAVLVDVPIRFALR